MKYDFTVNRIHDDGSMEELGEGSGNLDGVLESIGFHLISAPVGWAFDLTIVKR